VKGVFGLLFVLGGLLLAFLVLVGGIHLAGSKSKSAPQSEPAASEPGSSITTPGSTTGGQQP
jgi:hypothetical protein